jgi:hypothetical protein
MGFRQHLDAILVADVAPEHWIFELEREVLRRTDATQGAGWMELSSNEWVRSGRTREPTRGA